jgi:hypothetical protein
MLGGVSIDLTTRASLIAWEATPPGFTGPSMLNLATNILFNSALNSSGQAAGTPTLILANYSAFPAIGGGTLLSLKWIAFFCSAMVCLHVSSLVSFTNPAQSVFPAFYALYVSRERRSSVQAMQLSNGLGDPVGLWFGHLMFDTICTVILATIIIIVFATATNKFHGLGFFVSSTKTSSLKLLMSTPSGWCLYFTE